MTTLKVTFTMEADDPGHATGLTEESYTQLMDAVSEVGGYDIKKNSVNSRSGYMTPLGIPVVPPVYRMYTSSPCG